MRPLREVKDKLGQVLGIGCAGRCDSCLFNMPECLQPLIGDAFEHICTLERIRATQASTITSLRDSVIKQQLVRLRMQEEISRLESQIPRWIPVEERLPEDKMVDYLVTIKQKYPWETEWEYYTDKATYGDSYIDGLWDTEYDWIEGQETHITHWMPMPEPHKELEDKYEG